MGQKKGMISSWTLVEGWWQGKWVSIISTSDSKQSGLHAYVQHTVNFSYMVEYLYPEAAHIFHIGIGILPQVYTIISLDYSSLFVHSLFSPD